MLLQRVLTAIPLAALMIWLIFFQPTQSLFYAFLVISLIGGWEWSRLSGVKNIAARAAFAFFIALLVFVADSALNEHYFFILMLISFFWWLSSIVKMLPQQVKPASEAFSIHKLMTGLIILVPPVLALLYIHALNSQGAYWLFYSMSLVWVADIGAYFSGKRFGKHKLAPAISPGKTREGLYGALFFTSLYTLAAAFFFELSTLQTILFLCISLIATPLSVAGDLLISWFKRERGVKDSGNILPGHGGILDRIDSITSTAPFFALVLYPLVNYV